MDHDFINSPLIPNREPSELLLSKIMDRVALEKQRQLSRRKLFIFSSSFCLSLILIIPVLQSFISQAVYSGFSEYLHLAFYDFSIISSYGQEWTLSMLESLPALSLAGLLLISVSLLISLKNILANVKISRQLKYLTN